MYCKGIPPNGCFKWLNELRLRCCKSLRSGLEIYIKKLKKASSEVIWFIIVADSKKHILFITIHTILRFLSFLRSASLFCTFFVCFLFLLLLRRCIFSFILSLILAHIRHDVIHNRELIFDS